MLEVFMRGADAALSRTVLAERVWGDALFVTDNALDVTVSGLRQRLDDAVKASGARGAPTIETIRGVGYRLGTGRVVGGASVLGPWPDSSRSRSRPAWRCGTR